MEGLSQTSLLEEVTRIRNDIRNGVDVPSKKILKECEAIELKLYKDELSQKTLVKLNYRMVRLSIRYKNASETDFTNLLVGSVYIFMFYGLALIVFRYLALFSNDSLSRDFFSFLCFAMIGVAGAMLNLFTKGIGGKRDFGFRLLIAILFPVIFMNLFKIEGDKIVGIIAVNFIMFTCGFSSEFILSFLNKIVETAKKVINADGKEDIREKGLEVNGQTEVISNER